VAFVNEANATAIGRRLREFRKNRGLSQLQAARLFDVSERTYVRWENAHKRPHPKSHRQLTRAFNRFTPEFAWDQQHEKHQVQPRARAVSKRFFHVG